MKTILVTGGIGSGKSLACSILQGKGYPVFDCDSVARGLYEDPQFALEADLAVGGGTLNAQGAIDRKLLAERVFSSPEALAKLEALVHPAVLGKMLQWRGEQTAPAVVVESAIAAKVPELLAQADVVIEITAPEELRLDRAARRDGSDRQHVRSRMNNQIFAPIAGALKVENAGTMEELENELDIILNRI